MHKSANVGLLICLENMRQRLLTFSDFNTKDGNFCDHPGRAVSSTSVEYRPKLLYPALKIGPCNATPFHQFVMLLIENSGVQRKPGVDEHPQHLLEPVKAPVKCSLATELLHCPSSCEEAGNQRTKERAGNRNQCLLDLGKAEVDLHLLC